MAVTENRRMQQLRGKYADLDKSKMLVGEIAVPSDHSPIFKVDTDKYIELVSSEDTEYIEKITEDLNNALSDVQQLAIDKVGINNSVESDVQTYSSRKIQAMHNEQAQEISNQFKTASGTEIVAMDSSKGYITSIEVEGKGEQNGTPTPDVPIAILNSSECAEMRQGYYTTSTGVYNASANAICNLYPIPCKSGDVVKINYPEITAQGVIYYYNEDEYVSYTTGASGSTGATSAEFTVPSGATHFNFAIQKQNITTEIAGKVELTINDKYVLQIKSVGLSTDKESISTLLLNEPIRAVNNVKDVIEYVNDGYKARRKITSIVFNGGESGWAYVSTGTPHVYINKNALPIPQKTSGVALCSHFINDSSKAVGTFAVGNNYAFMFYTEFDNVEDWKAWLAENPITVQYEMAEEVIEDIADQTPFYSIQTYDGGTTISTTDRLQPQIKVEYPTNSVSGIASKAYAKSSIMSDKILSYQFRDLEGSDIGAYFAIELPVGVDGRNCTVLVSSAATSVKYSELGGTGEVWQFSCNSDVVDITSYILSDDGAIPTISGYIKYAKEGMYGHANVTVIRNNI